VVLVISVVCLVARMGGMKRQQTEFVRSLDRLRPKHPDVAEVNQSEFEEYARLINEPYQLMVRSNVMFGAEKRVLCISCDLPIGYEVAESKAEDKSGVEEDCPFCKATQPPLEDLDPRRDDDGDGIPNLWERKYKLDERDPSDADKDRDGDGFSNKEEFFALPMVDLDDLKSEPGSDMSDATSYPPVEGFIKVHRIKSNPFRLRFKAVSVLPDKSLRFQVNTKGNRKTHFCKMGAVIDGFKLVDYKEKFKEVTSKHGMVRRKDISELTIGRGDKKIVLVKGKVVQYSEYRVWLYFELDKQRISKLVIGDKFKVREEEYDLLDLEIKAGEAKIKRLSDGNIFKLRKK